MVALVAQEALEFNNGYQCDTKNSEGEGKQLREGKSYGSHHFV